MCCVGYSMIVYSMCLIQSLILLSEIFSLLAGVLAAFISTATTTIVFFTLTSFAFKVPVVNYHTKRSHLSTRQLNAISAMKEVSFFLQIFEFGIVFKSAVEDLIVANNVRQCVGLCKSDKTRNDGFP